MMRGARGLASSPVTKSLSMSMMITAGFMAPPGVDV